MMMITISIIVLPPNNPPRVPPTSAPPSTLSGRRAPGVFTIEYGTTPKVVLRRTSPRKNNSLRSSGAPPGYWALLSPFHYVDSSVAIGRATLASTPTWGLLSVTAGLVAIAVLYFERKDLVA